MGRDVSRESGVGTSDVGATPASPTAPQSPRSLTRNPQPATLDVVASLVDKSLLRALADAAEEQRFGMLETIREYGRERLAAAGEEQELRDRHLAWCVDFATRAEPELNRADQRLVAAPIGRRA